MGTPHSDLSSRLPHEAMRRIDAQRITLDSPTSVPATLFASHEVPIERDGVEQALEFLNLSETLYDLHAHDPAFFGEAPALEEVVLTPDFHRGSGIPVGTVAATRGFALPQAVGGDICCGMRLLVTELEREDLERHEQALQHRLRQIFFEGQRDIAMSPAQREAMLRHGLAGLNSSFGARTTWHAYDPMQQRQELERVHFHGSLDTRDVFAFEDFIRASGGEQGRDAHIGSIGGGNHFVELQVVDELHDHHCAHHWGVKRGKVAIMVHSGSVGLGQKVGRHFLDRTRELYPRGLRHPAHGFYPMPTTGQHEALYLAYRDAMRNAANFAFANRLFLGLMVARTLHEVTGKDPAPALLYDTPHNLIWEEQGRHVHRKGACPAYGPDPEKPGPFRYTGDPVIVPGSMGDASYLLAGEGNSSALCSACHGAGRALSRGAARKLDDEACATMIEGLRIVTPLDLDGQRLKQRPDIRARYLDRIKEEGPHSYKPISPVIDTIEGAGIARRVARLTPWLTLKST